MKELKHSKYKNTGILFELLVRQITADIIEGKESAASNILKKYFSKDKELYKEYMLYSTLLNEKFSSEQKSSILLETVIKTQKRLNKNALNAEKFNLVKELKEAFNLHDFFKTTVPNYKTHASIYKVFEYNEDDNPLDIVRSKSTLIDHIIKTKSTQGDSSEFEILEQSYGNEPEDIRILSYRILVNKFNEKYGFLEENQKHTLRQFILNISNSTNLKTYIVNEVVEIEEFIQESISAVNNKILKIKLTELLNLTESLKDIKIVSDEHVVKLLKLQELENELRRII
jgi:hypothetical protein